MRPLCEVYLAQAEGHPRLSLSAQMNMASSPDTAPPGRHRGRSLAVPYQCAVGRWAGFQRPGP